MQGAQEEDSMLPNSDANLNQNLYAASLIIGLVSAVLLSLPEEGANNIGALGAFAATVGLLVIPYNLLGDEGA